MNNTIVLEKIQKEYNKVVYKYYVEGPWQNIFRTEREYFIEYDRDISFVPDSILAIPFLANILPCAWVYDARIQLEEIDEDFIECIDEVKKTYARMFPGIEFEGRISLKKIVKNENNGNGNRSLLFFSGGVDATYSLISTEREKPMLCTLWGSDIFFQDKDGWNNVCKQVINTAGDFGLPFTFVKTSFRHILNYEILNEQIGKPNHENWWHGFQHGIGIIAHAAPLVFLNGIIKVYIASSVSIGSAEDFVCASTPGIDNNIKFCGASVLHEGIENTRGDKIRKICRYAKKHGKSIKLRVCWETRTGDNCCECEKCARTLMNILSEGYSPDEFGFPMTGERYEKLLEKMESGKLWIPHMFWDDIIHGFSRRPDLMEKNPLVRYLVEKYPQYGKGYKKPLTRTRILLEPQTYSTIILRDKFDFSTMQASIASVGHNSGNQVFFEAMKKNLKLGVLTHEEYMNRQEELSSSKVVTTDLIWINEDSNFDYLYQQLMNMRFQTMIPISVGLQAGSYRPDFKLNESVMRVLSCIQERAIIGVRGEYTADILEKHGIKNYEIIGCPSMYYWANPDHKVIKKDITPKNVAVNFRTIYGVLNRDEKHFLTYAANRNYDFVEQTEFKLEPENVLDSAYFNYVSPWLTRKSRIFFSVREWSQFMRDKDFSFGARFHGNVVALWNDVPALFIRIDSRTEELLRYFNLPFIKMEEFDETRPIEYFYELADYDKFNKEYGKKYEKYLDFLRKNEITVSIHGNCE